MAKKTLGKFSTMMFSGWKSEVTKLNHISSIFGAAPQKASNFMVQLFAKNYGKTLESLLSQFPVKEFESDDEYYWDVIGSARRNVALLYAIDEQGIQITDENKEGDNVGVNMAPFTLVFGEDMFFDGEVIFGNLNEVYPMRILGDPKPMGTNVAYTVQMHTGETTGIPRERLLLGEKFSAEYAPVERELSRRVGGVVHTTPASMRNEWSTIRLWDKVSGALLDRKIAMGVPMVKEDASGKQVKSTETRWMHYEEYAFEKRWLEYKNNILAYGVTTRNANGEYMTFGKSGEAIRQGDGLYAQMAYGNQYFYTKSPLALIEEALVSLSAGRLDFNNRHFVLRTGEYGAMQFNKDVQKNASGWTMFDYDAAALGVAGKAASKITSNGLKFGFQFVEYLAPNNVRITLEVDPHYDDPVHNKITHPNGGVAQSYRYDIFDFGTSEQPNIFKTAIKGKPEYRGYQWGLRNPWTGAMNNEHMSYDEDSASFHRMATLGICVLDPTRTISFIPAILAGVE